MGRDCRGGKDDTERIGFADDFAEADGVNILTYWQAQDKLREWARVGKTTSDDTIKAIIDRYKDKLVREGKDPCNATRVLTHLSAKLANKDVAKLGKDDLTGWRDELTKKVKPASVDRTAGALIAALNAAADDDERINKRPWRNALKATAGSGKARNVILDDSDRRSVRGAAYRDSNEFGELVQLLDETGTRSSQAVRLQGEDVQADFTIIDQKTKTKRRQPRVMMPVSRKGRGEKKITHRPVPITEELAERLKGRGGLLFRQPNGEPWSRTNLSRYFAKAVEGVQFSNPAKVTLYSLRHTSIVRQLLANVPVRVVAALHDTSVAMIERNYSEHIADHADDLARPTLPAPSEILSLDDQRAKA
jgi:integrase